MGAARLQFRAMRLFLTVSMFLLITCIPFSGFADETGAIWKPVLLGIRDLSSYEQDKNSPYKAVGYAFDRYKNESGTAFLVGPCHAITARHVIQQEGETKKLELYFGKGDISPTFQTKDAYFKYKASAELETVLDKAPWTELEKEEKDPYREAWNDWALMKIEPCLGRPEYGLGIISLKAINTREMARLSHPLEVELVGYPADLEPNTVKIDKCRVYGQVIGALWSSDCHLRPGFSGAPLLYTNKETGQKYAVAIANFGRWGETYKSEGFFIHFPSNYPTFYNFLTKATPASHFLPIIGSLISHDLLTMDADIGYGESDYDRWIEDITYAIDKNRLSEDLLTRRGLIKYAKGDIAGAIQDFEKAIEIDGAYSPALFNLSFAIFERGTEKDMDMAVKILNNLTSSYPDEPATFLGRAIIYAKQKNCTLLKREIEFINKTFPNAIDGVSDDIKASGCHP